MTAAVETRRRVTPTAVRVLPADTDRDTWLTARRAGIGSSDVAAILGLTDYRTPVHVWRDKRGEHVDDAGEPALWGTLLEDVVAREWARRNRSVIQRVGLVAHVRDPWMLATLDRRVTECPLNRDEREACALEVKCRNAFQPGRWRGDVPDDVLAQGHWQMLVTGYRHLHVAVLIGGNDYRQTVVRFDQDVADYLLSEVDTFRQRYVLPDLEPPWTPDKAEALIELDALMHPERVGEIGIGDLDAVLEYAEASAAKSAAERALKAAKANLVRLADGREVVLFADHLAYRYAPVTRSTCDLAALAERHPDAYADTVTVKTHHQIRLAPTYRQQGEDQ